MYTQAIATIHNDGVICYPTEGVWGIGCHPQSTIAFQRVLKIKRRPASKGVILIAGAIEQLHPYADITPAIAETFNAHKQAFITFILPKASICPAHLCGEFDSIAVRLTHYAPLRDLCLQAGTALVSTSANHHGEPPVKDLTEAKQCFAGNVDVYVDKPLGGQQRPSRIVRWYPGGLEVVRS